MIGGISGGYSPISNSYGNISAGTPANKNINSEQNAVGGVNSQKSGTGECQTCKNRKYVDGSDENVSFKSAAHISPQAASSRVRAHEGEHVSNAYSKAEENNGQVVNASVQIYTSVCPECGKTYVSGGVTNTTIKYTNESNPYMQDFIGKQGVTLRGDNVDSTV